ncbi:SDR family NAD(P)-dependent oxidoreductase, partial [bacterium]|nr:SDR family NAD(P)-dependent oxidoreductase [bacterium]
TKLIVQSLQLSGPESSGSSEGASSEIVQPIPAEKTPSFPPSVQRYLLETLEMPFTPVENAFRPDDPEKTVVVVKTSGNPKFDSALVSVLSSHGWSASIWSPSLGDWETLEAGGCPKQLQKAVLYIHQISGSSFERKTRKLFYREQILLLFLVASRLGKKLSDLIVLSDLGGELATSSSKTLTGFLPGVISAFCQSVEKDFPNLRSRGIDLESFSPELATRAIEAIFNYDSPHMSGLSGKDSLSFQSLVPSSLHISSEETLEGLEKLLTPKSVILTTGGAGGIASRLLLKLAREFRPKMVILGRTPERFEFLKKLRGSGSEAIYLRCDLADGPAVDRAVGLIQRLYSRIDLLIHAAGIEISRNLANKSPEEIDLVYRVKVAGLVNLLDAIGEKNIGAVVSFSSVASLFGNPGQVDYASANGFLNNFIGSGVTRFLTIAWSAWSEIGMASKGAVHEILASNDVEFIDPKDGERFFLEELYQSLVKETVSQRTVAYFGRLGENLEPKRSSSFSPRLNESAVESFSVEPSKDSYLLDHAISNRCVFPAIDSIDCLIQIMERDTSLSQIQFSSISFHSPIKMGFQDRVEMRVLKNGKTFELQAQQPSGNEGRWRSHMTCEVDCRTLEPDTLQEMQNQFQRIKLLLKREFFFKPLFRNSLNRTELYKILFHGRRFHVIEGITRFNSNSLETEICNSPSIIQENPLMDNFGRKFILEAALHGAGVACLLRVLTRKFFLPSKIDRLIIDLIAVKKPGKKKVFVEFIEKNLDSSGPVSLLFMKFNVVVVNDENTALMYLKGLRMIAGKDEPENKQTLISLGVPMKVGDYSIMGVSTRDAEILLNDSENRSGFLTKFEEEVLSTFGTLKRRKEWLAGRMALKILAKEVSLEQVGLNLKLDSFSILSDGSPPVFLASDSLEPRLAAFLKGMKGSISHGGEAALAVFSPFPVGVDVESLRDIEPSLCEQFLSKAERNFISQKDAISLWTAKEAICKAYGSGFGIKDLNRVQIVEFGYNEPYIGLIPDEGRRFSCMTFKDSERVASIASVVE